MSCFFARSSFIRNRVCMRARPASGSPTTIASRAVHGAYRTLCSVAVPHLFFLSLLSCTRYNLENTMDVAFLLQHSQYAIPIGIVLICAILVFAFGFKKAEQPPFAQLSDVDRKLNNKKRGKTKEKKASNGQVTSEKASPLKKTVTSKTETSSKKSISKTDEVDSKLKEKKQEDNKVTSVKKEKNLSESKDAKENKVEQTKNKKNLKNLVQEKPVDFDDGDWEQAYSRKDKKNKKKEEESPSKKSKKTTKKSDIINEAVAKQKEQDKGEIKDKVAKETENKELKEKDKKEVILTQVSGEKVSEEKESENEEKQNKTEKSEKEEKKTSKSKKNKKISEGENTQVSTTPAAEIDTKHIENTVQRKKDDSEKIGDSSEPKVEQTQEKNTPVLDESGDVKSQKKNKKKARKDN